MDFAYLVRLHYSAPVPESLTEKHIKNFTDLAYSRAWTVRDSQLERMEALYGEIDHASRPGIVLCFALAKIYDDLGEVDAAFRLLEEGNRHHRQGKTDTIADARKTIAAVTRIFSDERVVALEQAAAIQPIFVLGLPRSGTTLVEQILASHSQVNAGGELQLMGRWCVQYLNHYFRNPAGVSLSPNLNSLRQFYLEGIERLGLHNCITDKMPQNFLWTGFILSAFPAAKIVHLVRDPMAVCWSLYKTDFAGNAHGYACDLVDIAEFYKLYFGLMEFWRERFPGKIYDLNYERLTEQQENETRKLLNHCGLAWEPQCLEYYKNQRQVKTASAHQVKLPMYQRSSEAWNRYENHLKDLQQSLSDSL
ncbi:MAG: sulfotransferase [Gammaproteobacteria bacterium]